MLDQKQHRVFYHPVLLLGGIWNKCSSFAFLFSVVKQNTKLLSDHTLDHFIVNFAFKTQNQFIIPTVSGCRLPNSKICRHHINFG